MNLQEQFGANLRKQRLSQGKSQETLAYDADITMNYLSGIERGARNPSLQVIGQLANALRIQITDFFVPIASREALPARLKSGRRPVNFVRKKRSNARRPRQ